MKIYEVEISDCEILLGVRLDLKVNLYDHISGICKKAGGKLNALVRTALFVGLSKKHILMNAFFNYKLSNRLFICMCQSRTNITKNTYFLRNALVL